MRSFIIWLNVIAVLLVGLAVTVWNTPLTGGWGKVRRHWAGFRTMYQHVTDQASRDNPYK